MSRSRRRRYVARSPRRRHADPQRGDCRRQGASRTIFYCTQGAGKAQPDWPPEEVIGAAKVLFVDHGGVAGMVRAAQVARAAGIPVVADLEEDCDPRFGELLELIDHLILSRSFAQRITGRQEPAAAVELLRTNGPHGAVVVTCGGEGCWYSGADLPDGPHHQPAFPVEVVDTTGCGDVFHGADRAGLARGLETLALVRLASAAAALKATRPGGQSGIPSLAAVETFLGRLPPR